MTAAPEAVDVALALYGASLNENGYIQKGAQVLGVRVVAKARRFQYVSNGGSVLATSPATVAGVCDFVESFWFWKPKK